MPRLRTFFVLSLLLGISACAAIHPSLATPTGDPSTPTLNLPTPTASITPSPTPIPSPTPLACLNQPGSVRSGALETSKPAQQYLIYLPPCYDEMTQEHYPVLYLLHGQTYIDDQWVRLGAATVADKLIHSGQASPFIIVFPDDRYWNLPPGSGFGDRLINNVIPFIDLNFRTIPDRQHRALGGLSRGGGWAIHMLLTHYGLFGIIGLHSPVIFEDDASVLERLVSAVPSNSWPHLWMDAGDHDGELGNITMFETMLTDYQVPHEWHLYGGDHTEKYWSTHITEYLQWYAQQFAVAQPIASPTP